MSFGWLGNQLAWSIGDPAKEHNSVSCFHPPDSDHCSLPGVLCSRKGLKCMFAAISATSDVSLQLQKRKQDEQQNEQQKQGFHVITYEFQDEPRAPMVTENVTNANFWSISQVWENEQGSGIVKLIKWLGHRQAVFMALWLRWDKFTWTTESYGGKGTAWPLSQGESTSECLSHVLKRRVPWSLPWQAFIGLICIGIQGVYGKLINHCQAVINR